MAERRSDKDYYFGKIIGEGSFSTVYLAKEVDTGKEYAVKVCGKQIIIRENKQDYVKREKQALHLLNSAPGIISLACTFQDKKSLYFVLTYAPNGELLKYINRTGLSLECVKFYAAELLLAIEEMHKKNIIHRDLKPENLLLSRELHLMVADFGSSKILNENYDYEQAQADINRLRAEAEAAAAAAALLDDGERPAIKPTRRASFVGTAQYVSPEILKGNAVHFATDLWSFGCIIYQMLTGSPPFKGPSEYLIFQKILSGDFEWPENFDEDAKDLITKLLRFNPKDRLGAEDSKENMYESVRKHPFFQSIDWNSNLYRQTPPPMSVEADAYGDDDTEENFHIGKNMAPGLGEEQLKRILQDEFGSSTLEEEIEEEIEVQQPSPSTSALEATLEVQRLNNEWAHFVDPSELIIRHGLVQKKKKGPYITRTRMLVLTSKPRLIYIDPFAKVKKGEIPFESIKTEAKNFKSFFLHTPNRTFYLEDPNGEALHWCQAIDKAKENFIPLCS